MKSEEERKEDRTGGKRKRQQVEWIGPLASSYARLRV